MLKIDKNVPMPDRQPKTIYPFLQMEVGDSCFIPGKNTRQVATMTRTARRSGMKFVSENRTEDGKLGVRVWRSE